MSSLIYPPPSDLREDPPFALDSYNWSTFGTWEFDDPHRRAVYVVDMDFFNRERHTHFDKEEGVDEEEDDELQPPNLTEDEAMEMAIINRELDDLDQWDDLAVQLRAFALAQGRPLAPPPPPPAPAPPPAARIPPPVSQQPLHWPWPWGSPIYIYPVDDDDNDN
jgi:hypothetical protein